MGYRSRGAWRAIGRAFLSGLSLVLVASSSVAAERPRELEFDNEQVLLRLSVLGFAASAVGIGLGPQQECRICEPTEVDLEVALWLGSRESPELYATISDWLMLTGMALAHGVPLVTHLSTEVGLEDLGIVAQSVLGAYVLTFVSKYAVARRRPGVFLDVPGLELSSRDENTSFFSGHSAVLGAGTISLTTVAHLRGYSWRHWALGVGAALTLSVGVLRIAAQRHWATDVLTGWLVGAAFGVLVPVFLHPPKRERVGAVDTLSVPLLMGAF